MQLSVDDHVATVTMTARAMAPQFFVDLQAIFGTVLPGRDDVRAVVLKSAHPKAFSYGLDLMKAFQEHGPLLTGAGLASVRTELLNLIRRWQAAVSAVANLGAPTIAAMNGWCIGGGLDLATACDIRLASADTKISLRETKLAIVADVGTLQRLPHIVGQGIARELAFTGKDIDAARALQIHLVNSIHESHEAVVEAAHAMATEIAANAPLTVAGTKQVLNHGMGRTVEDGLEYVAVWNSAFLGSEDLGEAVAAFTNRRPPVFKGR
ncbi:MAG: enoyl-CoA hydratase [Myxococcota bacterium]|jgi:enoyl-CoA hydratase